MALSNFETNLMAMLIDIMKNGHHTVFCGETVTALRFRVVSIHLQEEAAPIVKSREFDWERAIHKSEPHFGSMIENNLNTTFALPGLGTMYADTVSGALNMTLQLPPSEIWCGVVDATFVGTVLVAIFARNIKMRPGMLNIAFPFCYIRNSQQDAYDEWVKQYNHLLEVGLTAGASPAEMKNIKKMAETAGPYQKMYQKLLETKQTVADTSLVSVYKSSPSIRVKGSTISVVGYEHV